MHLFLSVLKATSEIKKQVFRVKVRKECAVKKIEKWTVRIDFILVGWSIIWPNIVAMATTLAFSTLISCCLRYSETADIFNYWLTVQETTQNRGQIPSLLS